jgi:hypothetical protein
MRAGAGPAFEAAISAPEDDLAESDSRFDTHGRLFRPGFSLFDRWLGVTGHPHYPKRDEDDSEDPSCDRDFSRQNACERQNCDDKRDNREQQPRERF